MPILDWLIIAARVVALAGFVVAFFPSVRRIFQSETRGIWRTRLALSVLMFSLACTQVYSVAFRLWDFQSDLGAVAVAILAALAGLTCAWAFWPWRKVV